MLFLSIHRKISQDEISGIQLTPASTGGLFEQKRLCKQRL